VIDDDLRAALAAVEVPHDLEARLLAIPEADASMVTRRAFWIATAAAIVLAAGGAIAVQLSTPEPPRVVAIKFWHEHCPYCRELDPSYASVVEQMRDDPVVFLTFDMSTERSRARSAAVAEGLGIRELYEERFGTSGYVVLLDHQTRALLGELTFKQDVDEMMATIDDAIARAT
jgi:thiol-disulfide isomerase/thioredoxin